MSSSDKAFVNKRTRQEAARMPGCLCSNCEPESAKALIAAQPLITNISFDLVVTSIAVSKCNLGPGVQNLAATQTAYHQSSRLAPKVIKILECKGDDVFRKDPCMIDLVQKLRKNFDALYTMLFALAKYFLSSSDILSNEKVWKIAKNHQYLLNGGSPRYILGNREIEGDFECITGTVKDWFKQRPVGSKKKKKEKLCQTHLHVHPASSK